MLKINDRSKLEYYINKYDINNMFEKDMSEYMELHLFNKNQYICKTNENLDYFYFLVEGKAKVYTLLKNGRSLLLQFYKPLKVIGDIEFIDIDTAGSNIQAVEQCLCIGISMINIRSNVLNDTKFLRCMCKILGGKLDKLSKSSSINLLYPLENRLASYIISIASENDNLSIKDELSTNRLTEMADLLGTSYRHLTRTLNKLSNNKLIKKEHNSLVILDRKALEELAGDIYG